MHVGIASTNNSHLLETVSLTFNYLKNPLRPQRRDGRILTAQERTYPMFRPLGTLFGRWVSIDVVFVASEIPPKCGSYITYDAIAR